MGDYALFTNGVLQRCGSCRLRLVSVALPCLSFRLRPPLLRAHHFLQTVSFDAGVWLSACVPRFFMRLSLLRMCVSDLPYSLLTVAWWSVHLVARVWLARLPHSSAQVIVIFDIHVSRVASQ